MGLERCIAAFTQTVVTQVAFEALDHPFDGWTPTHDRLKALGHGRVVRIDLRQGIKRDCDDSPGLGGAITTASSLRAVQTHGCAIVVVRGNFSLA